MAAATDLLIVGGILVSWDDAGVMETPGWLAVTGGRIAGTGAGCPPVDRLAGTSRVIDASNMAVLPGLVNGHTHLSQTFLRGLADDRPLMRWLKEIIWPAQAAMTPDDMYLAALLGLIENLRCGATGVVQHHKLPGRAHVDAACRAAVETGLRVTLARGWVDLGNAGEPVDAILGEMKWLHETWGGAANGIQIASGPLAPWRCSDEAMRAITELARSWGAPTHIHVAEARDEIDLMRARCGQGHIEWLSGLGCLGPDTQLVHAVHVTDAELDLAAEAGAAVVHCPTSNMYLASGAAPVTRMQARGIPVVLGTDGSGSNNSQDLLECAKVAALLAKHSTGDAQALLPADIVRMLAGAGGRGRLALGEPADITLVDLNNPRCQPVHSAASALVYNANGADVHTVIAGGTILLDAGQVTFLDEDALLERCRRAASDLMARAGIVTAWKSGRRQPDVA
jgi:5-methylthioadenosine/S-adenosylhomocysteine deaminase